jgi:hypothetical protein
MQAQLAQGALLTVDPKKARLRLLPLPLPLPLPTR